MTKKQKIYDFVKFLGLYGMIFLVAAVLLTGFSKNASAQCVTPSWGSCPLTCRGSCSCVYNLQSGTEDRIRDQYARMRVLITDEFRNLQNWIVSAGPHSNGGFFVGYLMPAMMMMTEQLVATGMQQMMILGVFLDADLQLDTQRLFQTKVAQAHKDYRPSIGMCTIGTAARGLSSAYHNGQLAHNVLSRRSLQRQLGLRSSIGATNSEMDRQSRIRHFIARYCDPRDNNHALEMLCATAPNANTINKDIDFARTIGAVRSLNIDFTDPAAAGLTGDEQDVMALAANLFSSSNFERLDRSTLSVQGSQQLYMDLRGLVAKRSVAENSFYALVGRKTAGTESSEQAMEFTKNVLRGLGLDDAEQSRILYAGTGNSETDAALRPSYYAQMEILAQKIYQSPSFFTNLYDTPANVERKNVAMQAIGLMLDRDRYKSELRSEMTLSVLLELELMRYQNRLRSLIISPPEHAQEN